MCLYSRIIANPKYKANKKNGGVIPAVSDKRILAVPIGCGNCIECRKKKRREWTTRLSEELRTDKNCKMITLTFSNEAITKLYKDEKLKGLKDYDLDNAAATLAVRRFLERWRKKYKKSLKHWLVTELGHNGTENIHMHGILWTTNLNEVERIWNYGWVYKGKPNSLGGYENYVNEKTVNYSVKYITKTDNKHKFYKPKILVSPGIGRKYVDRLDAQLNKFNTNGETREVYINKTGVRTALPMYLRGKIYSEEEREKLWIQKLDKNERYVLGAKIDVSQNHDEYYKALKEAQEYNLRMGYGGLDKDWKEEEYERRRRIYLQEKRMK